MSLGEKILELRKKSGFSQEQLGEQIGVTRQTISNWELGETAPNPEQLKQLSKTFNISIDELLNNEYKEILMKKVNNTEKLAGIIIKILKIMGIIALIYIGFLTIAIISLMIYTHDKKSTSRIESKTTMICEMENVQYQIELGSPEYFKCNNCTPEMNKDIKKEIHFNNIEESLENIENYFLSKEGKCN